jgi:hypothetical protein
MDREFIPDVPALAKVLGCDPKELHNLRTEDGEPVFKMAAFRGRILKWRDCLKLTALVLCGGVLTPEERRDVWNLLGKSDDELRYLCVSPFEVPVLNPKPVPMRLNLDLTEMARVMKKAFAALEKEEPAYFERHVQLGGFGAAIIEE